jgi:hypothetical protein
MRRIVCLLSALAFIIGCANPPSQPDSTASEPPPDPATYTRVQWVDSIKDFGSINMGDSIQITFTCRNIGEKPLFLTQVNPSCGCTVASYSKEAILPGQTGFVTGTFNSNRSHPGEVRKTIFVTTNTQDGVNHTLTFTGKIVQPVN